MIRSVLIVTHRAVRKFQLLIGTVIKIKNSPMTNEKNSPMTISSILQQKKKNADSSNFANKIFIAEMSAGFFVCLFVCFCSFLSNSQADGLGLTRTRD